ncbi:30S ribosomal protein S4e [Candidatus Woesearchaeota archaeon]|nr:30S ribosomal protein S4e [Candidatus Woesearchaeota archaeon]
MSEHLKRYAAPKSWGLAPKGTRLVAKPNPGPHPLNRGVPLTLVLKRLGMARTSRDVRMILQGNKVMIDGKRRQEPKLPIGLMDSVVVADSAHRVVLDRKGRLTLVTITTEDAATKSCRITRKTPLRGGKVQVTLNDGRNIRLDKNDYSIGDTLTLKVPGQEIQQHIPLAKGSAILLTAGKHLGKTGTVDSIHGQKVRFVDTEGALQETIKDNTFAIPTQLAKLLR